MRRDHLQYLITYESPVEKIRLGNKNDGGYVIANLSLAEEQQPVYDAYISAGVSNEESFTRDFIHGSHGLAEGSHSSHCLAKDRCFAFDGTIEDYPYEYTTNITFIKKNIGPENTANTTNMLDILSKFENIFLKMDIEGGEYPWLLSLFEHNVLKNIKQITMEFHGINDDSWNTCYEAKVECFRKLSETHYIIHAHGNNWGPRTENIPDVIELTFLRRSDFTTLNLNKEQLPCILDSPNKSDTSDYDLNMYPFVHQSKIVPKVIYQTWKWPFYYIQDRVMQRNPTYTYEFYDDERMDEYMRQQPDHVRYCYQQLSVGAAKADLWRYIILYEKGGIYLDIDSEITGNLDELILPTDRAIISREGNPEYFLQWMMIFEPRHPILQRVIDICIDNIRFHKTNNIFELTGPAVFTQAIKELTEINAYNMRDEYLNNRYQHICRFYKQDFAKYGKFKHENTCEIYDENYHWKDEQINVLKPAICTFRDMGRQGRLGNVLFQYAALLGFAARKGSIPKILEDIDQYEHHSQKCLLRRFPIQAETISEAVPMNYHENCAGGYYDANIWNQAPLINLCGQYESEQYFIHIKDQIKKEFSLYPEKSTKEWLGIHFRRGDDVTINNHIYTTDEYNISFIYTAIEYLKQNGRYPQAFNKKVIIFTGGSRTNDIIEENNDREWCRQFMSKNFPELDCTISEKDVFEDFKHMQQCENFIINSSSSMAWWAGYLNNIPNKMILVGPSTNKSEDYWPKEFTVIEKMIANPFAKLHIFTCLTDKSRVEYLKKTANKNGAKIKYIFAESWNGYKDKITAMRHAINDLDDKDIVCFVDAYDVLINDSSDEIKRRFFRKQCDLIFGAEMCCYPEKHLARHIEYNKNISKKTRTNHVYLNAGGYIGYVHAIRKMLYWKSDNEIYYSCSDGTDQAYMMEYLFENPEVKLDTEADIFLNMHKVDWKEIYIFNGKIRNKALNNEPCIVHFNGGYWQTNNGKSILPIITEKILESNPYQRSEIDETCIHPEKCIKQIQSKEQKEQNVPYGLKYIDHVFYINLNRRPDRRKEMEDQLKKYNIDAERFEAIDRPEPTKGIVGCTMSHMETLKLAKLRNYQTVLILEDDFEFQVSPTQLRKQIYEIFENNVRFDVCMLGYKLEEKGESKYPFLIRSFRTQSASAYIITRDFYQTVIDLFEWAIPLLDETGEHWTYANDQIWNYLQPNSNWYCLTPRVGKQRDGYSDNSETNIVYDC